MQESKKFALDVGITFIASVINMLLGFIITVLLGRYLGAGELGLYQIASTIYGIAVLVAGIGIPAAMIKYVAEYKEDRKKSNAIVSSGVITSLLLGISFSILFYLSSGMFEGIFNMLGLSHLLKIFSPVFPFALVGGALLGLFNGLREMKKYGIATIIQSFLMLVISVPLIYLGYGVAGAVIGVVLSSVGSCLYLLKATKGYFKITFEGYVGTTKDMLRFGAQIFGANAINLINYQADTIMIGYFLTSTDVGYYGVAIGLSKFFWIIPQAVQTIMYPATSEYWANKNHAALQSMIDKSMKYTACILLPIGLGVGFFAKEIITTILGPGFEYSILPLYILLVGTVINGAMQRPIGSILYSIGMPELNLRIFASAAMLNVILNLVLIPKLGIAGAAIATSISFLLITFLILAYGILRTGVLVDFNWFIKISLITILYISVYHFFGEINPYIFGMGTILLFTLTIWIYMLTKEDKFFLIDLFNIVRSRFY